MSTEQNKALARRYFEAIDRGDLAALDQILSPDFRYHLPGSPAPLDRAGHRHFLTTFYAACPDLSHTVEDIVAEGDRVATRATDRGTQRGELMGIPPTGKQFTITGINIVRVAGGRIAEEWVVFDQLGMLQQLGVMPGPGQTAGNARGGEGRLSARSGPATSTEENKALVHRFLEEVIGKGNLAVADELLAPTYTYHAPGMEVQSPAAMKQVFTMLRTAFPDWYETVEDLFAEGDKVVFRVIGHGTHQGDFMGIPPTGKRVTMHGIDIVRLEGGKLAEHWAIFDQLGMMQQLGVIPAPGQAG